MPNTALNRTTAALLTNKSGSSAAYGAIVIQDSSNASAFTTTTTAGLSTAEVGIVIEPNGIANNAQGMVAFGGYAPTSTLNTSASIGQFIKTHTVAGQGTPHASPQVEGDFAVALASGTSPALLLFGSPNGPLAGGAGTVTHTGSLTANQLILGNASADITALGSLGTTTTLLHGNAGGAPTFSAVALGADVSGFLALANMVGLPLIAMGRLTTESGVPVSASDRTAQGTLYYTPAIGPNAITNGTIALYDGTRVVYSAFTELSLGLTVTSGKNYDVFVDYNSGTPQLVLSAAWTTDTARADALGVQSGLIIKSGTAAYRWVGTIRASGTNVTADSGGGSTTQVGGKRFVWNAYQQVPRSLSVIDTANTWTYANSGIRVADGATAPSNCVEWVTGTASTVFNGQLVTSVDLQGNVSALAHAGIGIDSATVFSGLRGSGYISATAAAIVTINASYVGMPGLGYHYASWLENGADGTTSLWLGDNGGEGTQSGMTAWITG